MLQQSLCVRPVTSLYRTCNTLLQSKLLAVNHTTHSRTMMAAAAGANAPPQQQEQERFSPRVLSIQSSVVHGYVGNKAAVFPLQLLGFDVDPINSVQLSNHTGYPLTKGHVFDGSHLQDLLSGLTSNGLICHTHLLTGYIGSLSLLQAVAAVAKELRRVNPNLTYVCDPVLGDEGEMYVSKELKEAYITDLLPLCNVLTPNQFEAELLTGLSVTNEQQALAAAEALHKKGPHTLIITSLDLLPHPEYNSPPSSIPGADPQPQEQQAQQQQQQQQAHRHSSGHIVLVASTKLPQAAGCPSTFCLRIPKRPGYFTGTGDLLAALLLAHIHHSPDNLAAAVELAVAGLQGVLAATAAAAGAAATAGKGASDRSAAVFKAKELQLIQSQGVLLQPTVTLRAQPLQLNAHQ